METKDLLHEARVRYPLGTIFMSTYQGDKNTSSGRFVYIQGRPVNKDIIQNDSGGWVYSNGNWATILDPLTLTPIKPSSIKSNEIVQDFQIY